MPRGQYDRSKSKAQRAAEKNADAPKSTVKKVRAPYGSKKLAKAVGTEAVSTRTFTKAFDVQQDYSIAELASFRSAFSGQHPNTVILTKIDSIIVKKLDALIGTGTDTVAAPVTKQAAAPIQAVAPIPAAAPFNPSVPPNGQA